MYNPLIKIRANGMRSGVATRPARGNPVPQDLNSLDPMEKRASARHTEPSPIRLRLAAIVYLLRDRVLWASSISAPGERAGERVFLGVVVCLLISCLLLACSTRF